MTNSHKLQTSLILVLLVTLFFSDLVIAQPSRRKIDIDQLSVKERLTIAEKAFNDHNYYGCMPYYRSIYREEPENMYVVQQLAKAYREVLDYGNAERYYEIGLTGSQEDYPIAIFDYGLMLKMNGKYKLAKQHFKLFVEEYRGRESKYYRARAQNELVGCTFAMEYMEKPLDVEIINMGETLNSPYYELGPVLLDDNTMIFSSLPSDTIIEVKSKRDAKLYVTKLYSSSRTDDIWSEPKALPPVINDNLFHTANGTFSLEGSEFFFSRCDEIDDEMMCKIYMVDYNDGKWGEPVKLGENINVEEYSSTQPAIGKDYQGNDVLYFVSNRPRGEGKYDIWYSRIKGDMEFETPVNLGKKINTKEDDITPNYDEKEKMLYFSSEGHVGFGGMDIYQTDVSERKWKDPINVGFPINSSVDDLYFTLDKDRSEGYNDGFFVSNRAGSYALKSKTCCNDIYRIEWIRPPVFAIKGFVYEKGDKERVPINEAMVTLEWVDSTINKNQLTHDDTLYFWDIDGDNKYKLTASAEGYLKGTGKASTKGLETSDTLHVDLFLEKIVYEKKAYTLRNIYYDYDDYKLRDESELAIDTLLQIMNENLQIVVEIGSHTDSKGNNTYNRKLSQKRAQSVVNYLIANKIPTQRLKAKGYGESNPVAENNNPDGSDNPEGRQRNRRTEFKIIGKVDGELNIIN
ncbi:MAG: OmpA family protein [Bacteroidetes bacterium]|nr:OmpA family protein [Bacteroidota bacterium]